MASAKWEAFAAQFRSYLPLLRALARDGDMDDEADTIQGHLDDATPLFPDELSGALTDELYDAADPDDTKGPVATLPPASELSDGKALEVLQQHSLNALVQRTLERRILSGELAPGTKLV